MQPAQLPDAICKERTMAAMASRLAPCLAAVAAAGLLLGPGAAAFIAAAQLMSLAALHTALRLDKSRLSEPSIPEQGAI